MLVILAYLLRRDFRKNEIQYYHSHGKINHDTYLNKLNHNNNIPIRNIEKCAALGNYTVDK